MRLLFKYGSLAVGFIISTASTVLLARDYRDLGLPIWAWYAIGLAIMAVSTIFIIIGFSKEIKEFKKSLEEQTQVEIKKEKINQRQIYIGRKQGILDQLLKMDVYLANTVDQQTITVKAFTEALGKVFPPSSLPSLFVGTFTFRANNKNQRFLDYNMRFTLNALSKINVALKDYKLGTLIAQKEKEYKLMDSEIRKLENGFPLKVVNGINQVILYNNIVNCLRLIDPDRTFWKKVEFNNLNEKTILAFKTMLSLSQWQIQKIMDNARGEVSEEIDKYLAGD